VKGKEKSSDKDLEKNFESSSDPKFKKRTAIMLKEIKKKLEDGEIDDGEYRILEKALLENPPPYKTKIANISGNNRTSDPKFKKRTAIMLKEIKKKLEDGEIDDGEYRILEESL
jgi:hypothetical protein